MAPWNKVPTSSPLATDQESEYPEASPVTVGSTQPEVPTAGSPNATVMASPVALNVRAIPSVDFNASMRAEFDSRYKSLRTVSANGTYSWTGRILATAGWSKQGYIPQLQGFNDPNALNRVEPNVRDVLRTQPLEERPALKRDWQRAKFYDGEICMCRIT